MSGRDGAEGGTGPAVKICGIGRPGDVRAAAAAGAAYVGLVLAESPRRLDPSEAAGLARAARDAGVAAVGVFVDRESEAVVELAEEVGFGVAQLHGEEPAGACERLREAGLEVWKAIRPRSRRELQEAVARYRDAADALLVEGWSAERAGGTGTAFPHAWLAEGEARRAVGRLVLAGGLAPGNVGEAVRRVGPDVVDVSTGVEAAPGRKDADRIRAFVAAVRSAARTGGGGDGPGAAGDGPAAAGSGSSAAVGDDGRAGS